MNRIIRNIFANKMAHYAKRDPKSFLQIDAFYKLHGSDKDGWYDKDGDTFFNRATTELMIGADVRVLIPCNTNPKLVIRHLKKITKWLSVDSKLFDLAKPVPEKDELVPEEDDRIPF